MWNVEKNLKVCMAVCFELLAIIGCCAAIECLCFFWGGLVKNLLCGKKKHKYVASAQIPIHYGENITGLLSQK